MSIRGYAAIGATSAANLLDVMPLEHFEVRHDPLHKGPHLHRHVFGDT
jgi:hypothetical protein